MFIIQNTPDHYPFRPPRSDLNDNLLNSSSSSSEDDPVLKQKERKKKKRGRKAKWSQASLDDLVDIIISSEYYKKKLIFTNQKNQRNGEIYEKVLANLKKRAASRGEELPFNSIQVGTKFKKCVSECKNVALKIKTASGVERFIEQKDYGKWFNDLFAIVKTRDACRPDLALEPSGSEENLVIPDEDEPSTSTSFSSEKEKLVINKRSRKRNKQDMVNETLNLIKSAIENDPTKEVLSYLKDESEKARAHELKMLEMLNQGSASTFQPQQQYNIQYPDRSCPVWQYNTQSMPSTSQESEWSHGFFNAPPFS